MDSFVVIDHRDISEHYSKEVYQRDRQTLLHRFILFFFDLNVNIVNKIKLIIIDDSFQLKYDNLTITKDAIIYPNGILFFSDTLNTIGQQRVQELTDIEDAVEFFHNVTSVATILTSPTWQTYLLANVAHQ